MIAQNEVTMTDAAAVIAQIAAAAAADAAAVVPFTTNIAPDAAAAKRAAAAAKRAAKRAAADDAAAADAAAAIKRAEDRIAADDAADAAATAAINAAAAAAIAPVKTDADADAAYTLFVERIKGVKKLTELEPLIVALKAQFGYSVDAAAVKDAFVNDVIKASMSFKAGDVKGIALRQGKLAIGQIDQRIMGIVGADATMLLKVQKMFSKYLAAGDGSKVYIVWSSKEVRLTDAAYTAFLTSIEITPTAYDGLKASVKRFFAAGVNLDSCLLHCGNNRGKMQSFLLARAAGMVERKQAKATMSDLAKIGPPVVILDSTIAPW